MSLDSGNATHSRFTGVVVALGANLGDPKLQIYKALGWLATLSTHPIVCSSIWETTPVDCPPNSPRFANAVALLDPKPALAPLDILDRFQFWERESGRAKKQELNEPRPLDLDLIAWGGLHWTSKRLVLPHPRAHLRQFVLQPLAELLPDWVLPGQTLSVRALLDGLPKDAGFRRWEAADRVYAAAFGDAAIVRDAQ